LLLIAAFARHGEALDWAKARAVADFGPLALESQTLSFDETDYYAPTMGARLVDPGQLAEIKRLTNGWESEYANVGRNATPSDTDAARRPLNLDPGYLDLAKLVLASTKDHAHRIYLGQGIHAEVTLQYRQKAGWQPQPWTFPDYRRADYHAFFDRCREYLHRRIKEGPAAEEAGVGGVGPRDAFLSVADEGTASG
jgi:hypothetical protein